MIRFIAIVLTAFLERVNPVSNIANPTCMNITRNPATSTQARLSDCSTPVPDGAAIAAPGQSTRTAPSKAGCGKKHCPQPALPTLVSPNVEIGRGAQEWFFRTLSGVRRRHEVVIV